MSSGAPYLSPVEVASRKSDRPVMRNAKADIPAMNWIATKTASVGGLNKDPSAGSLNITEELDLMRGLAMGGEPIYSLMQSSDVRMNMERETVSSAETEFSPNASPDMRSKNAAPVTQAFPTANLLDTAITLTGDVPRILSPDRLHALDQIP
jgi:hypothetical protein